MADLHCIAEGSKMDQGTVPLDSMEESMVWSIFRSTEYGVRDEMEATYVSIKKKCVGGVVLAGHRDCCATKHREERRGDRPDRNPIRPSCRQFIPILDSPSPYCMKHTFV